MTIPEKLKVYKDEKDMTNKELAVLLGYNEATICLWITGGRKMARKAQELVKLKLKL